MSFIEPSFEIDEKGRVICQSHSNYPFFATPNKTYIEEKKMENLLTCKTCVHFKQNNCYFPQSEIIKIEKDRILHGVILCKLCGNKIDRMLTVIQKFYLKDRFNIEMPLVCCSCYESLKKNEFISTSKRKSTNLTLYVFYMSLLLLFNFVIGIFFGYASVIMIIGVIMWLFTLINYLRRLYLIKKGRKYYTKYFNNNQKS